ncbi:MAG: hypothetical protein RLZZ251_289 [Actinomycetota bacterium]|jgi:drug/metabolite transporter (DMT)-like permease
MAILLAPWALLGVAAMWGISFVWMKDILDQQDVYSFLFTRFVVAALFMFLIKPQVIRAVSWTLLRRGLLIGAVLGAGYIFQTLGLERTTPAITGFVTGLYVVLTPVLGLLVFKDRLSPFVWIYVALATAGLAVLSLRGLSVGVGEFFVLVSALLFAIHILLLSRWSQGLDAYALTIVQLIGCAVISSVPTALHGYSLPPDRQVWSVVFFTAVFATAFAFVVQTWSQARISATKVAVILTMEVVFAALFSVAMGREELTPRLIIGGTMVVVAMIAIVQPRLHAGPPARESIAS